MMEGQEHDNSHSPEESDTEHDHKSEHGHKSEHDNKSEHDHKSEHKPKRHSPVQTQDSINHPEMAIYSSPPEREQVHTQPQSEVHSHSHHQPQSEIHSHHQHKSEIHSQHQHHSHTQQGIQSHPTQYQEGHISHHHTGPKNPDQPMSVNYTNAQPHHQQVILVSPPSEAQHSQYPQNPQHYQGAPPVVITRTKAPVERVWWYAEISKAAHIFALALLLSVIFAESPWLSWFTYYSDYCRESQHKDAKGVCTLTNKYRCSACVIIGYVWVIFAFFLLLARLILWLSTIEFRQKTKKYALMVDGIIIALIFVSVLLTTIGATIPDVDGKSQDERDYPLKTDLMFGAEMSIWFALISMLVAVILDFLDMRADSQP